MFPFRGAPRTVRELALLGGFCAASVLVVTTAGTAQLLADEGSEALPVVYLLLAAVSIPVASSLSRALGRRSAIAVSRRACYGALAVSAVLQAALILQVAGCHLAICTAGYVLEIILDTMFWLVVAEYLPTRELKRHTPKLAMAFAVGGVGGGISASGFCQIFSADYLMLLACLLLAVCCGLASRISRRLQPLDSKEAAEEEEEPGLLDAVHSSCAVFRAFPISGLIAASIVLMSALFCLQDYLAMTIFADTFTDEDALARFMALVFAGQQAVEIVVLATCGSLVVDRAGPLIRNLFFPLSTAVCLIALLGSWTLPVALLVSLNANAVSNGIFEPVKTLNYAAVPHRSLGSMRMLVEGIIYPLGIAGSGAGLLFLQARFAPEAALSLALFFSIFFVASSVALGVMFVPSMIRSLRLRSLRPSRYAISCGKGLLSRTDALKLLGQTSATGASPHAEALVGEVFPALLGKRLASGTARGRLRAAPGWLRRRPGAAQDRKPGGTTDDRARSRRPKPCADTLAPGLDHPKAEVRLATARAIAPHRGAALPVLAARLDSERPEVAEAAILALGLIASRRARRLLKDHLRKLHLRVQRNLAALVEVRRMTRAGAHLDRGELFCQALEDRNRDVLRRILDVQAALGNRRDVALLHHLAVSGEIRERSDAVEALTSGQYGQFLRPLLHLLEARGDDPDDASVRPSSNRPSPADIDAVLWAAAAEDSWLRLLAAPLLTTITPFPGTPEEVAMLNTTLFLKSLPLFNPLSFESIARAAAGSEAITLSPGAFLPASVEPFEHVHILRDGCMELLAGGCAVQVLEPGAFWGVGAVIGDDDGDVKARAASKCHLLRLPTSVVTDLAAENPQMLRTMLRDTHRMQRAAYLRLAFGPGRSHSPAAVSGSPPLARGQTLPTEDRADERLSRVKNLSAGR